MPREKVEVEKEGDEASMSQRSTAGRWWVVTEVSKDSLDETSQVWEVRGETLLHLDTIG